MKRFCLLACIALIGIYLFKIFHSSILAQTPSCKQGGDFNCSGIVDLADLSFLLANFGSNSTAADVDGSGSVNLADLTILLGNFGKNISTTATCYGLSQNMYPEGSSSVPFSGISLLRVNRPARSLEYVVAVNKSQSAIQNARVIVGTVSYPMVYYQQQSGYSVYQGAITYDSSLENQLLMGPLKGNRVDIDLTDSSTANIVGYFGGTFSPTSCTAEMYPGITPTPVYAPPLPPLVWKATHEDGTMDQWRINDTKEPAQDSFYCSRPLNGVTDEVAHTGQYSLKMLIDTTTLHSGCRTFRYLEAHSTNPYYYSAWFYLPEYYDFSNGWSNLMQFKANREDVSDSSDLFWSVGITNYIDPVTGQVGDMFLFPKWDRASGYLGPTGNETKLEDKPFYPTDEATYTKSVIKAKQWFHLEMYLKQSTGTNYDGQITVWVNVNEIFTMSNVLTKQKYDPNSTKSAEWHLSYNTMSMNSYGGDVVPNPFVVYVDDAAVSTQHIGPSYIFP